MRERDYNDHRHTFLSPRITKFHCILLRGKQWDFILKIPRTIILDEVKKRIKYYYCKWLMQPDDFRYEIYTRTFCQFLFFVSIATKSGTRVIRAKQRISNDNTGEKLVVTWNGVDFFIFYFLQLRFMNADIYSRQVVEWMLHRYITEWEFTPRPLY